jgi:hypothetical protein
MTLPTRRLAPGLLLSALFLAAACSEPTAPAPAEDSTFLAAEITEGDLTPTPGFVRVCKVGPALEGGYSFSASKAGTPGVDGTLIASPFTVDADSCLDIWTATPLGEGETSQPRTAVTVTEDVPDGFELDSIVVIDPVAATPDAVYDSNSATADGNNYIHGSVIVFYNSEIPQEEGCTLTQGYWKTHPDDWPEGYDPSDAFFGSGMTWQQVLDTPPAGGNSYLILAHQYIAATLSAASGASVPDEVQDALDAAEAIFTAAGANTYAKNGDWNALAKTLDDYNNGITGPGHCDDLEVLPV